MATLVDRSYGFRRFCLIACEGGPADGLCFDEVPADDAGRPASAVLEVPNPSGRVRVAQYRLDETRPPVNTGDMWVFVHISEP